MAPPKPCKKPGCDWKKDLPSHFCYWHRIERLPIDEQIEFSLSRRKLALKDKPERARVPQEQWPARRRWCSGCQWMVPMWYVQGTRCKACESHASYSRHLKAEYGIDYEFYLAMYHFQGGRCYICRRQPLKRRLAVDHDHKTGAVRGLLCSGERSCNHDILGNITSVDMARRIVTYLEDPPATALKEGRAMPVEVATASAGTMAGQSRVLEVMPTGQDMVGWAAVMQKARVQKIEARARLCWEGHYSDKDFWRFPEGHAGPFDIFHALPDKLDPEVWEVRLRLAKEKRDQIAARRMQDQG